MLLEPGFCLVNLGVLRCWFTSLIFDRSVREGHSSSFPKDFPISFAKRERAFFSVAVRRMLIPPACMKAERLVPFQRSRAPLPCAWRFRPTSCTTPGVVHGFPRNSRHFWTVGLGHSSRLENGRKKRNCFLLKKCVFV